MRPGGLGTSRMIDSDVTYLPQPDSPTMPSVSPGASEKLTPSTAANTLPPERNSVRRSLTSRRASSEARTSRSAHDSLRRTWRSALRMRDDVAFRSSRHRPRLRQAVLRAVDRRRELVGGAAGPVALAARSPGACAGPRSGRRSRPRRRPSGPCRPSPPACRRHRRGGWRARSPSRSGCAPARAPAACRDGSCRPARSRPWLPGARRPRSGRRRILAPPTVAASKACRVVPIL